VAKQSLKSLQADALNEGFLDDLGNDKTSYADKRQAPVTERLLIEVVGNFLLQVQENLNKANKVDTGTLSESVSAGDLVNSKGVYSIEAGYPLNSEAANYAPFVNQGVKGFLSGEPSDSPFSFKSARPKYDGVMVDSMLQWVKRNGISSRNEDQRKSLSGLQRKRQSVGNIDVERQTAYQIASRIKQRGLPKTDFFTSAVRQYFGDEFVAAVGSAFLSDVRVYIKQANALINSENK
jgi:hypothetical protein